MKTNIIHIIGGLNRGGAETMLMNIFRNIDKNRYQFYFLVFYPLDVHQDFHDEVLNLGGKIIHLENKYIISNIFKVIKIYKENKIDVVHAHTLFNSYLYILAATICGIKIRITHSHSTGQMRNLNLLTKIYIYISKIIIRIFSTHLIACSNDAGNYLFGKKLFKKKGILIKNAIDTRIFYPQNINSDYLDLTNLNLKIGCIGSFYDVKNHLFLIELANYMVNNKKFNEFNFIFVGKGYLEKKLKQLIRQKNLDKYFKFLGTRTDINKLMNFFDVLVMPSLYEGIPVTLIEAQASGLPCVISDNISKDVDLHLNLITFCNINENYEEWYQKILDQKNKHLLKDSRDQIQKKLDEFGYSLECNIKILSSIYSAQIKKGYKI